VGVRNERRARRRFLRARNWRRFDDAPLDHVSGAQYLSATIGQIRYFSIPRVTIPEDILRLESGLPVAGLPLVNPLAWPGLFVTNARPPAPNRSPVKRTPPRTANSARTLRGAKSA